MTPAGMTFSTLAGMAGGGLQSPGVMGHGKFYLLSDKFISAEAGEWGSFDDFVYQNTGRSIERMTLYSVMDAPMTSCGCFECIMMVIPETNGVMIVSREDPSMTPAGMTFSTLAGIAGGGLQTPGLMGHGKFFLTSKKFISKEGGIKRVVWLSSVLKESMKDELQVVFEREGVPDLLDQIADERVATTVEELVAYIEEKGHPALAMDPLF